jgi:aminomethyltransferase
MKIETSSEQSAPQPIQASGKKTALYENHVARGAKMVDFAGWQMPLQYGKVMEEHHSVREVAGLFDISHMGLVTVSSGNQDATRAFLEWLVPQDLSKLNPGKAVYTQFLNENGGIIDDIIVYELPALKMLPDFQEFLIICNAANTAQDIAWMKQQALKTGFAELDLKFIQHEQYALLALQGPDFAHILARTGYDTDYLPKRFRIAEADIQGTPVLISRTGYTGEDGVEIIVPASKANVLWDLLMDLGRPLKLASVGLAARDTLRLEAAYPLHGHDISEVDSPLEAGLGWSVKLDKSADFIGKKALQQQVIEGLKKELFCFTLTKRTIARQHDVILKNGVPVGEVTSGSISPLFNVPIGMGYIRAGSLVGLGDIVQIQVRDNAVDAEIVERPFYQKS